MPTKLQIAGLATSLKKLRYIYKVTQPTKPVRSIKSITKIILFPILAVKKAIVTAEKLPTKILNVHKNKLKINKRSLTAFFTSESFTFANNKFGL